MASKKGQYQLGIEISGKTNRSLKGAVDSAQGDVERLRRKMYASGRDMERAFSKIDTRGLKAVSYTHLDVYKRQSYPYRRIRRSVWGGILQVRTEPQALGWTLSLIHIYGERIGCSQSLVSRWMKEIRQKLCL